MITVKAIQEELCSSCREKHSEDGQSPSPGIIKGCSIDVILFSRHLFASKLSYDEVSLESSRATERNPYSVGGYRNKKFAFKNQIPSGRISFCRHEFIHSLLTKYFNEFGCYEVANESISLSVISFDIS